MTALIGRENEFRAIEDHVKGWLGEGNSECLFVNGVPGTGKTATVSQVVKKLQEHNNPPPTKGKTAKRKTKDAFKYVYVNCHGLTKQLDLCTSILTAINDGELPKKLTARTALNQTETILMKTKCLMVLDEMDSLRTMGTALFAKVFTWPSKSDGNVFIIGISNLLNIADSCLPRRYADCKPSTITFKAYTTQQIVDILMERLKSRMDDTETKAIELCARKVAAVAGDIRKAFTLADGMMSMRPEDGQAPTSFSTPRKGERLNDENMPPPATPTTPRTPASACRDAIKLISQVEASPFDRATLPFQPKFTLACILRILSKVTLKKKAQTVTKQQVFDICDRASKKLKLEPSPPEVVSEALDMLSMQGMVMIAKDQKIHVIIPGPAARAKIADNDLIAQINDVPV